MPSLEVSEGDEGGARILELRGELDVETEPVLRRRLLDAVERCPRVVLDAAGLTFIDSHGMRLLLAALRISSRRQGRLVIACENPTVLRLFQITGMDRNLPVVPNLGSALADAG